MTLQTHSVCRLLERLTARGSIAMKDVTSKNSHSGAALLVASSLILVFLASGCSSISYPVWLGVEGVARMCEHEGKFSYTHLGVTKQFEVNLVDAEGLSEACGKGQHNGSPVQACILNNERIFATPGNACPMHMAHELSHGFGMHFVDRPTVHRS